MKMSANNRTVSVVVPVLNEAESLPELTDRIVGVCRDQDIDLAEIVFVDDGSTDTSWQVMSDLAARFEAVRAIRLQRNFGKAAALDVGIRATTGAIVVTMDADLQDDPDELPRMLEAFDTPDGPVDLVSGWKKDRHDPLSKTLPSKLFNRVTAWISGVRLHDFNCGYKAYRREIFDSITLYGELHRYVPVLAHARGYRVTELAVRHHARQHGKSKYGLGRLFKGFIDLLTVLMLTRFAQRPGHLFGGIGLLLGGFGGAILVYLTLLKLFTGAQIGDRPLLLLGVMATIIAVQFVFFGTLAELIVSRTSPSHRVVQIRDVRD